MLDQWLCPLMALLGGVGDGGGVSMERSQAEASVSGTVRPSCGPGPPGFIRALGEFIGGARCVEKLSMRAADGADFGLCFLSRPLGNQTQRSEVKAGDK